MMWKLQRQSWRKHDWLWRPWRKPCHPRKPPPQCPPTLLCLDYEFQTLTLLIMAEEVGIDDAASPKASDATIASDAGLLCLCFGLMWRAWVSKCIANLFCSHERVVTFRCDVEPRYVTVSIRLHSNCAPTDTARPRQPDTLRHGRTERLDHRVPAVESGTFCHYCDNNVLLGAESRDPTPDGAGKGPLESQSGQSQVQTVQENAQTGAQLGVREFQEDI